MLKLKRSFANLSQDEIPELSLDLSYPQKAAPSCHQAANFTPFRFEPADDIDETRMLRPAKRQRFFVRQTVPEALVQLQQQNETPQQLLQQQQQQQQLKGPRDSCFKAPEEVGLGTKHSRTTMNINNLHTCTINDIHPLSNQQFTHFQKYSTTT